MDTEMLSAVAGAALSLAFSYIPGLRGWYERLGEAQHGEEWKRLVMLAALLVTAAGVMLLSCSGWAGSGVAGLPACDRPGLVELLRALIAALVANQSVYLLTPPAQAKARAG